MARIVIVEDDDVLAEIMSNALEAVGHSVSIIENGNDAVSAINSAEPDLVMLDYALPGRSGMAILRDLRCFAHEALPVMMVTARAGRIHIGRAATEGVDDYMIKPLEMGELIRRTESLLKGATIARSILRAGNVGTV